MKFHLIIGAGHGIDSDFDSKEAADAWLRERGYWAAWNRGGNDQWGWAASIYCGVRRNVDPSRAIGGIKEVI